jgi:CubicO group peptidase (beta-lactamase class C family)
MQLVEEGRISLDEPVTQILTQLPIQWSAVTVRHCSH